MSTNVIPGGNNLPSPRAGDVVDVEDIQIKTDTRGPIRLGFWVLIVGFGLFMLWAAFAPLDEGVAAPATVSIETRRKSIQHVQGGIVQRVLVKEGQMVKKGDVLIELDEGVTRAGFEGIRQNYISQRALESRLIAELTEQRSITFHPDLLAKEDPVAAQQMAVQTQLFNARRSAQASEIAAAEQSILGLQGQIRGLNQVIENRKAQQVLQARQFEGVRSLADDGFAPRNQALQLEQQQAEIRAQLSDLDANVQRVNSSIAETRLKIAQRRQEYTKEVSGQLSDVRREVQANQERLTAVTAELGRTAVRSPVDGQIVGLQISGVGSVVTPGQKMMDVVPQGAVLLLDAKVSPAVIDRVAAGDPAEVRFSSFANAPTLVVHGQVSSLSGDAVTENVGVSQMTYFLARVAITPEGMKALGERNLHPGMQAEVLIKTGERSLLTYLMHPLTKRVAAAMTEE